MSDYNLGNDDSGYDGTEKFYSRPSGKSTVHNSKASIGSPKFVFENSAKNTEVAHKFSAETFLRDLCPVWKPSVLGNQSPFSNL